MFGKGKTKDDKKAKRPTGAGNDFLKGLGLDIPNFDDPNNLDMDDDDGDFEAELRALQEDTASPASKRAKPKAKPAAKPGGLQDLQSLQKDVHKLLDDIDRPINDDELSETDEAELMAELGELVDNDDDGAEEMSIPQETRKPKASAASSSNNPMVSLLQEREKMYIKAVATAKAAQESTKVRRFERQLKVIQELIQSARTGAKINEDEIPPALSVAAPPSQPEPAAQAPPPLPPRPVEKPAPKTDPRLSSVSVGSSSEQAIARLKALALQAQAAGDMGKAREYVIELKKLQGATATTATQISAPPLAPPAVVESQSDAVAALPLKAPVPTTVLEALQQRHDELAKRHEEAMKNNESAKARRFDRQVKQYQEAIDATKKKRPYNYSELPELPGFAPIPGQQAKAPVAPAPTAMPEARPPPPSPAPAAVQRSLPPTATPQIALDSETTNSDVQSLHLKREQMRKLAVQAKDRQDFDAARRYVNGIKLIDEKIKKAESTSTITTSQYSSTASLPTNGYEVIRDDQFTEELAQCDRDTIYDRLRSDLLQQIQLCARNQQMYAQMEGATNAKYANDFKLLEQRSSHDLEQLKQSYQKGFKTPVFHYEKRQLNLIQSNHDLMENELEVTIIRGINLSVPSGFTAQALETYVTLEFPYPPESSQTGRTRHGTGTSMVEYPDARFRFTIKRSDTKLRRLLMRKELRLAIFYKAGFLRADRQLGVAALKLASLDTCATVHDSVDIFENDHRKKAQGKLEVKIRIREALGPTKTADSISHRLLIIDRFDDTPQAKAASLSNPPPRSTQMTRSTAEIPKQQSSTCTCF